MTRGLWDWQDDDAARLTVEGKRELAECWEDFDLDGPALSNAAAIARAEHEPVWELFYLHWFVQQSLFRENRNLQQIQPEVERLTLLASDPSCSACPQRFCARESVANFQQAADPPGFAQDVLDVARTMARQVPKTLECHSCFDLLEVAALLELERPTDATVALDRLADDLQDANVLILVMLFRAAAALQRRDLDVMAGHLDEARALLNSGAEVNPDNSWFVLELELKCMIARGEIAQADALSQESPLAPPLGSAEAMRIAIVMAEAWACTGQWAVSRRHAERALTAARTRGMVRYAAEAALWAGEACQQTGDREGQERYASGLSMLIPQLRTRDLDQRAKNLGAAIP